tara:strand:- start:861 stop:1949 length:1089 start_codon:yes stop_codon:yes gene_type:complete
MPRTKPGNTVEHRISLSNYERDNLKKFLELQERKVTVNGVTDTLGAVGSALAGGGLLWAAAIFGIWKAPTIGGWISDKIGEVTGDGGLLDDLAGGLIFDSEENPITLRREAQRFAARRAELNSNNHAWCTINADSYDIVKCENNLRAVDQYFAELLVFRQKIRDYNEANDAAIDSAIYSGLGDIDPDKDGNPLTSRRGGPRIDFGDTGAGTPVDFDDMAIAPYGPGDENKIVETEQQINLRFTNLYENAYYQKDVGAHIRSNMVRYNPNDGTTMAHRNYTVDLVWDGQQWLYAGSHLDQMNNYYNWRTLHLQRMATEQAARLAAAKEADPALAVGEGRGYWDGEQWRFDGYYNEDGVWEYFI